jgi:hypothetical protein
LGIKNGVKNQNDNLLMKKILKVFVCCQKYIHRVEAIKARVDKWTLGDYLIFVGGDEEKMLEDNVMQLQCRDLYEDLPEKMFAIYKYLSDNNFSEKYNYFWKIDDDIDWLRWNEGREVDLLKSLDSHDYAGFQIKSKEGKRGWHIGRVREDSPWYNKRYDGIYADWAAGGATYFLSAKSIDKFKGFNNLSEVRYQEIYEDLAVAKFLKSFDILPVEVNPWLDKSVLKFDINK